MRRCLGIAAAVMLCVWFAAGAGPARAQELAPVEKLFADLAALPADKRQAALVEGARKEGTLRLINSLLGTTGKAQLALFQKQYPFIKVEMSELGSQDAADRLVAEESAGRHLTDVVAATIADLATALSRGFIARYPTPATERVRPQFREFLDPANRWVPMEANEHGLVYNTSIVKQPPASYEDLCDARFKGSVSFDPLEVRFLVGLYKVFGDDMGRMEKWLECIGRNTPIIQRGHTQRFTLMLAGDHAASPDQYVYTGVKAKAANPAVPFGVAYDAPITVAAVSAVINKNTPNPHAAALFADWVLSDECQGLLAKEYRGAIAIPHPYFPSNVKLVFYQSVPPEVEAKLVALWQKHVGK